MNRLLADFVLDIIKSPEAEIMRRMVTYGFYDSSRIALWMMEVIGREYDDMARWSRELKYEIFPQTCTWSLPIWEWVYGFVPDDTLSLEFRRGRILAHRLTHPPINPARIEAALSALTGTPVHITEFVTPYTFRVDVDESSLWDGGTTTGDIFDHQQALRQLRRMKPSHLSFTMTTVIEIEYYADDYHFGAVMDVWVEHFFDDIPIPTEADDYHASASVDVISENFFDEIEIPTEATDLSVSAFIDQIREVHME
ncbi:MAG: YmfQ family protein [Defluviitaleaceae bacterium]|nr:YmfQ family protein [Defluviitaleaceae bacterium]